MNPITETMTEIVAGLDPAFVLEARREATGTLNAVERIAASFGADSDAYLSAAAAYFRMRPIGIECRRRLTPEFDIIPFVEANKRLCIAFSEHDDALLVV